MELKREKNINYFYVNCLEYATLTTILLKIKINTKDESNTKTSRAFKNKKAYCVSYKSQTIKKMISDMFVKWEEEHIYHYVYKIDAADWKMRVGRGEMGAWSWRRKGNYS